MITEQLQIENACHTTDSGSNTTYSMGSNAIFLSSAQNAVNKNLRHTPEGEALGKWHSQHRAFQSKVLFFQNASTWCHAKPMNTYKFLLAGAAVNYSLHLHWMLWASVLLTAVVSAICNILSLTKLMPSRSQDLWKLVCLDTWFYHP